MARKSMKQFIKENRTKITALIIKLHPDLQCLKSMNDKERTIMVKNEPALQKMAKDQGVVI